MTRITLRGPAPRLAARGAGSRFEMGETKIKRWVKRWDPGWAHWVEVHVVTPPCACAAPLDVRPLPPKLRGAYQSGIGFLGRVAFAKLTFLLANGTYVPNPSRRRTNSRGGLGRTARHLRTRCAALGVLRRGPVCGGCGAGAASHVRDAARGRVGGGPARLRTLLHWASDGRGAHEDGATPRTPHRTGDTVCLVFLS
ncbi:hypothetical protein B0H12DRAFT_189165 [Mycena haematopus]|nr:hypothetical protein B0H12DRAFT_189165 [Mycena haematopus]